MQPISKIREQLLRKLARQEQTVEETKAHLALLDERWEATKKNTGGK